MRKDKKIYGQELILDLFDCDPKTISSKKEILEYLEKICRVIRMKRYGKAIVRRFGFGKNFTIGFSFVQLIETSSIVGHISELWQRVFINIFSCKLFNLRRAILFTRRFFGAKKIKKRALIR